MTMITAVGNSNIYKKRLKSMQKHNQDFVGLMVGCCLLFSTCLSQCHIASTKYKLQINLQLSNFKPRL